MALGLKGGFALAQSGLRGEVLISLGAATGMAILVPVLGYLILRRFLNGFDAAAIAATMALMESPAIVLAVVLANHARQKAAWRTQAPSGHLTRLWDASCTRP